MIDKTEIRCEISCREDDSRQSPGRLTGTLIRYGDVSPSHRETFERGALEWDKAEGVILKRQHKDGAPIMKVHPVERDGAVVIDQELPDTAAGRDLARELRDKLFTHLSIEFRAAISRYTGGLRRIARARLVGAGVVFNPSYPESRVELRGRRRKFWIWQ